MTLYPNFDARMASKEIVEDGTTYIIQQGRRYGAEPPHDFVGVEPGGMRPDECDPEKVKALCAEYDVVYSPDMTVGDVWKSHGAKLAN